MGKSIYAIIISLLIFTNSAWSSMLIYLDNTGDDTLYYTHTFYTGYLFVSDGWYILEPGRRRVVNAEIGHGAISFAKKDSEGNLCSVVYKLERTRGSRQIKEAWVDPSENFKYRYNKDKPPPSEAVKVPTSFGYYFTEWGYNNDVQINTIKIKTQKTDHLTVINKNDSIDIRITDKGIQLADHIYEFDNLSAFPEEASHLLGRRVKTNLDNLYVWREAGLVFSIENNNNFKLQVFLIEEDESPFKLRSFKGNIIISDVLMNKNTTISEFEIIRKKIKKPSGCKIDFIFDSNDKMHRIIISR